MILSTLTESRFKKANSKASRKAPEKNSSLLSVLTFWWINSLINTGYKRDLTRDDLWEIDDAEKSERVTKKLEQVWNPKAQKCEYFEKFLIKLNRLNLVYFKL